MSVFLRTDAESIENTPLVFVKCIAICAPEVEDMRL
jgi:hypothetical protein